MNEPSAPQQISSEYKGMIFRDLVRLKGIPIEGTATYGNKRLVFRGEFKIVETGGSWRWGPQLQLKLWNSEVTAEDAVNPESLEKWGGRMEIYLPLEKGLDVISAAYGKIMRSRSVRAYLLPTILPYCTYLPTYETLPKNYLLLGGVEEIINGF